MCFSSSYFILNVIWQKFSILAWPVNGCGIKISSFLFFKEMQAENYSLLFGYTIKNYIVHLALFHFSSLFLQILHYTLNLFLSDFSVQDFEIDKQSQEYLALHPMASKNQPSLVEEHFDPVMEDEDQNSSDSDASAASPSSEDKPDGDRSIRKKSRVPR